MNGHKVAKNARALLRRSGFRRNCRGSVGAGSNRRENVEFNRRK